MEHPERVVFMDGGIALNNCTQELTPSVAILRCKRHLEADLKAEKYKVGDTY